MNCLLAGIHCNFGQGGDDRLRKDSCALDGHLQGYPDTSSLSTYGNIPPCR
jgi:hypothetical protein